MSRSRSLVMWLTALTCLATCVGCGPRMEIVIDGVTSVEGVVRVRLAIYRDGSCADFEGASAVHTGASAVHTDEAGPGEALGAVPDLPRGRYVIRAVATDATCFDIASACEDVDLPRASPDPVSLVLDPLPLATIRPDCLADGTGFTCVEGTCTSIAEDAGVCGGQPYSRVITTPESDQRLAFQRTRVFAWGSNDQRRLENSDAGTVTRTVVARNPLDAATARDHTCVIALGGDLRCWGGDPMGGQNGSTEARDASGAIVGLPDRMLVIGSWHGVAAAEGFTCGLASYFSGREELDAVICFGVPPDSAGLGTEPHIMPCARCEEVQFARIAAGGSRVCALDVGGLLRCWDRLLADEPNREVEGDVTLFALGEDGTRCHVDGSGRTFCDGRTAPLPWIEHPTALAVRDASTVCAVIGGDVTCGRVRGLMGTQLPIEGGGPVTELTATGDGLCARTLDGSIRCIDTTAATEWACLPAPAQ